MAHNFIRVLCQRNLNLQNFRCLHTASSSLSASTAVLRTATCENHEEKNLRLKRPLSPHLLIYQPQLTTILSISHRITGIIWSSYAVFLSFGTLFIPGGIPCLIEIISNWCLPTAVLILGKALFAFPITYHYFNGLRHLIWDLGKCLTIKDVYSTGWIVVAVSTIAALVLSVL